MTLALAPFPASLAATTAATGKSKETVTSNDHPGALSEFDYAAANENADRTAERIEYVFSPLFGMEEDRERTESMSASASASHVIEEEHGDEGLNDSELDDILKDDWLLEGTGSAEVADSQTDPTAPTDAESSSAAEVRRQGSEEKDEIFVSEEEEMDLWTGPVDAEGGEKDEDSIFVLE